MNVAQNLADNLHKVLLGKACFVNDKLEVLAFREVSNNAVKVTDKHSGHGVVEQNLKAVERVFDLCAGGCACVHDCGIVCLADDHNRVCRFIRKRSEASHCGGIVNRVGNLCGKA